ncbi:MAG: hypothetical protein IJ068_04485 [Bacilli bacterium]|nr:hypothetical protein [Bacilli bacterium]
MQLKTMNDNLRKIEKLKNITFIKFVDLSSTNNDKYTIIPGFMVFYNGLDYLFLTSKDEYFLEFVKKLREVYLKEKDNIVKKDFFGNKYSIEIDDITKKLLLEGELDKIEEMYSFLSEKEGYNESLFFKEEEVKGILPIVKYHLENTLSLFSISLEVENSPKGYQGLYYLKGRKNGIPCFIPMFYLKNDYNTYYLEIGGLFDKSMPISMNISFKEKEVVVDTKIEDLAFSNHESYKFSDNKVIAKRTVYLNQDMKIFKSEELKPTLAPKNDLMYLNGTETHWYLLPWNAYYGGKKEEIQITEDEKINSYQTIYFDIEPKMFFIKENYSKQYQKSSPVVIDNKRFILDNMESTSIGYEQDKVTYIETSFNKLGTLGYFKQHLAGKYFYHIANKELKSVSKNDFIALNQMNGIYDKTDLLRTEKIKKLIKEK